MKRLLLFLLALLCVAQPCAADKRYEAAGLFALTYPDGWTADDQTYAGENDEYYTWLCDLTGGGARATLAVELLTDWAGFSLQGASQADIDAYRQDIANAYFDCEPRYEGVTYNAGGSVPFVRFVMTTARGECLYAATMTDGREISIQISGEQGVLTEEARAVFDDLLSSFVPQWPAPETPTPDSPTPVPSLPEAPTPAPAFPEAVRV